MRVSAHVVWVSNAAGTYWTWELREFVSGAYGPLPPTANSAYVREGWY